jgi:hypothetical protein
MAVIHSLGEFPLINLQFDRWLTPSAGFCKANAKERSVGGHYYVPLTTKTFVDAISYNFAT